MKALLIEMPDGSTWAVPVDVIARNRAENYADDYGDDIERSLAEDTVPLFENHPDEVSDWAANNMDWIEVADVAWRHEEAPAMDFQEGWVNGEKRVEDVEPPAKGEGDAQE